jgi:hypothetical protein
VRQGEQAAVVFQGMVRTAHHTVSISTTVANQDHRQIMETDVITNLFEGSSVKEGRDAIRPRSQSATCQAGRNRDHILLRHAGIDEARTHGIAQWLQSFETEVSSEENEFRQKRVLH